MKIKILFFSVFLFAIPFFVLAAGLVPCGGATESPCGIKDIFILFIRTTNTLIGLASIYAVYQIINGGFWLVVSMGNEEAISTQRKRITQAVVGFVFSMMAYMLVNTVVNLLLLNGANGKCKLDLKDPLNYLIIHSDPKEHAKCRK